MPSAALPHASAGALKRFLRNCGAPPGHLGLIEETLETCECARWKHRPDPRPVASIQQYLVFNECVYMDLMHVFEVHQSPVLHVTEARNRLSAAGFLRSKTPAHVFHTFVKIWIPKAGGIPAFVRIDPEGEFANNEFEEQFAQWGIECKASSADAKWPHSLVERHNAMLRGTFHRTALNCPRVSKELVLLFATEAHNHLANIRGMTPWQLTNGSNPRVPNLMN